MRADGWPWARHHATWRDALAVIAESGLPGDILVGRHPRRDVFVATISRCVPMTVQQGEGHTPLEAVQNALAKANADTERVAA